MHGPDILRPKESPNTLRSGGMNNALNVLTNIMKQATSTAGKHSSPQSIKPKECSSIRKSKKS